MDSVEKPFISPRRCDRRRLRATFVRCTLALSALCAGPGWPQAASPAGQASEVEVELWRAASRLDSEAAYRAYLDQFPNGTFAPMARAALQKLGSPAATPPAPGPAAAASAAARAELKPWQGKNESGAVTVTPGERFEGPGIIAAGWLGARRQFVLPRGSWILLASFDGTLPGPGSVGTSTLAFGQFSGAQLRTLLVTQFNSRTIRLTSSSYSLMLLNGTAPRWRMAEDCETQAGGALLHEAQPLPRGWRQCTLVQALPAGESALRGLPQGLAPRIGAALEQLGARMPRFAYRFETHVTANNGGYLGSVRMDCALPGVACDDASAPPAPQAIDGANRSPALQGHLEWARRYAEAVRKGEHSEFQALPLQPDRADPVSAAAIGL